MRENPENKGFTNGKYYYYQTTNGNWDIGPGIDDTRMKENFHYRNGGHLSRKVLRLLSKDFRTINHLA